MQEAERPSVGVWDKVEPVYSVPNKVVEKIHYSFFSFAQLSLIILQEKVVKHVHLEEEVKVIQIQSSDGNLPETTNGESKDPVAESKKSDGKIKEKLALLKKQTEEEVIKMKEKTSGLVNSLKAQKEQTRGRSRYSASSRFILPTANVSDVKQSHNATTIKYCVSSGKQRLRRSLQINRLCVPSQFQQLEM